MRTKTFILLLFIILSACTKNIDDYPTDEIVSELNKRHLNDLLSAGYTGKIKTVEISVYPDAKWENGRINEGAISQQSVTNFNEDGYKISLYESVPAVKRAEYLLDESGSHIARVTEVELKERLSYEWILDDRNRIAEEVHNMNKIRYIIPTKYRDIELDESDAFIGKLISLGVNAEPQEGYLSDIPIFRFKSGITYNDQDNNAVEIKSSYNEQSKAYDPYAKYIYQLDPFGFIDYNNFDIYQAKKTSFDDTPEFSSRKIEEKDENGNVVLTYMKLTEGDHISINGYKACKYVYY